MLCYARLSHSDYYVLPGVKQFDSWDELLRLLARPPARVELAISCCRAASLLSRIL
jgi:hypothetical protein